MCGGLAVKAWIGIVKVRYHDGDGGAGVWILLLPLFLM